MKIAILLLILSLGFIWDRGDFGNEPYAITQLVSLAVSGMKTQHVISKAPEPPVPSRPTENDLREIIHNESRQASANEFFVQTEEVKAKTFKVFTEEKNPFIAQTLWLESHKIEEERTVLDKLRNLAAWGKYE